MEYEFWRLTESLEEEHDPIEYGADIPSTIHGSGFPTNGPHNPYSAHSWNLNNLPLDEQSLFRHVNTAINGMTLPWLYVGMCFSTFCWHSEDQYTYSINYQHVGDIKTWYGVPGEDAKRFENAMQEALPELFEHQPELLFQLVTLLCPDKLKKAGVRVYALDQHAGEFVVTFPQAYHAGFNHGFNFNEAVNFAPPDWEPFGASAIQRLQMFRRQPVFCHEQLLFSAASQDRTMETARWLGPALRQVVYSEIFLRQKFTSKYRQLKANGETGDCSLLLFPFSRNKSEFGLIGEDIVCDYCKAYCFLSLFKCNRSGKVLCMLHATIFACCDFTLEERISLSGNQHSIYLHMTDDELASTVWEVARRCLKHPNPF